MSGVCVRSGRSRASSRSSGDQFWRQNGLGGEAAERDRERRRNYLLPSARVETAIGRDEFGGAGGWGPSAMISGAPIGHQPTG